MTVTERPDETTASPGARYWHRSLHDYAAMTASGPGAGRAVPRSPRGSPATARSRGIRYRNPRGNSAR